MGLCLSAPCVRLPCAGRPRDAALAAAREGPGAPEVIRFLSPLELLRVAQAVVTAHLGHELARSDLDLLLPGRAAVS